MEHYDVLLGPNQYTTVHVSVYIALVNEWCAYRH